jgi:uncharacterized protein (DUF697 family)/GTP-binding protein EngB required for normal cell division
MRMDERITQAFEDPADLRALLLGAAEAERAELARALNVDETTGAEGLAETVESLVARTLTGEDDRPPNLALSLWAAEKLGAGLLPSIAAADEEIVRHSARGMKPEIADADGDGQISRLLQIAITIAHMRQKKMRRLRWWSPLLDRFVPRAKSTAPAPRPAWRQPASRSEGAGLPLGEDALWDLVRGAGARLPLSVWEERLTEARKTLGRFNIIVAGRTGVGKTTLIGAIFGEDVGNTLMGRPRTRGRIWYPVDPSEAEILRLCDTEGLEMERYKETLDGLKREIASRNASSDPFDHIHVAWLCIDEPSLTVQPGEEALVEMLARQGIPVIVVLTKAGMAPNFVDKVKELIPNAVAVIRVRAMPISMEGQTFPQMGLDALMEATERAIPTAVHAAWHVASHNLEANIKRGEVLVRRAAAAAGAAGAAPIPLADAAGVFGVQVGMIVAVSLNMGVKLKRSDLRAMAVTLLGALGLTAGGRFLAGQVLKLVPGIGTVAGSALTGTTAAALTYGLGRAYLEYLRGFYGKNRRMPEPDELVSGFRNYWSEWKNKHQPPPNTANS